MVSVGCQVAPTPKASSGFALAEKWRFRAGADIATKLTTDGEVVVARTTREVVALDVQTGTVRWRRTVPRGIFPLANQAPLLIGDGLVVVPHYRGVMVLDSRDGAIVWQVHEPEPEGGAYPAAITPDTIYVVGYDVIAYDRPTGAVRWRVPVPGQPRSAAGVFAQQDVVLLIASESLQIREADNGVLLWKMVWQDPSERWNSVGAVLRDGRLYHGVGLRPEGIAAFDVASRREVWRTSTEADFYSSAPAFASGRVFLASDASPAAFDTETGAVLWRSTIPAGHYLGPALVGGVLYVREEFSRMIYGLSTEDGTEIGRLYTARPISFPPSGQSPLTPVATDERLLFVTGDTVYAYGR